jgi:transaldolase
MPSPLVAIIEAGSKLWLDSVDPDLVARDRALGATGATSNPIIISDLVKGGRYDNELVSLMHRDDLDDEAVAWTLTDRVVHAAQQVFRPVYEATRGDDGYVSFELDPLLEDLASPFSVAERTERYIELGTKWSRGHANRLVKVPATPGGIGALEELCARGVSLNVTLIFSMRQYEAARNAIWRGAQRRSSRASFKSVYSIFISRLDVYTEKFVPSLSEAAQGQVGLVNAKQIWQANQTYWATRPTPLKQEIVFASTGVKRPGDPPWKYVEALVGSDIQTNPPATNEAVQASGRTFRRTIDQMPPPEVLAEIAAKVDAQHMEQTLMEEGLRKFADPQKALLGLIADKRAALAGVSA